MKKQICVYLLCFISISIFSQKSYLQISEKEAVESITQKLTCQDKEIYPLLQDHFEKFLLKNKFANNKVNICEGYYNYLIEIVENGGEIGTIKKDKAFKRLKKCINCSGHNIDSENIFIFLYATYKPIVEKYHSNLLEENNENEWIYLAGTISPNSEDYEINLHLTIQAIVEKYTSQDFNREILKQFVILLVLAKI